MDITDIELIRAIVQTGSLSEACQVLNQSQPTLSRKLSRLEDQLNVALFHRSPKGLAPTEIAAYVLAKAEPIDHKLREIERHVELITQRETGFLNLGVGPITEQIVLPQVLHRFVETTGKVSLSVVTEDHTTLLKMFDASELDLVVGPYRAQDESNKDVIAIPMVTDDIIAVARTGHPVFKVKKIKPQTLRQFSMASPAKQGSATQAEGGPPLPRAKIRSDNYDLLKKLVLTTDMFCAAPRAVFADDIAKKRIKQIPVDLRLTWESSLLIRAETLLAPLAHHLVSLFKDVSAEVREASSKS